MIIVSTVLLCWLLHREYTSFHYFGEGKRPILLILTTTSNRSFGEWFTSCVTQADRNVKEAILGSISSLYYFACIAIQLQSATLPYCHRVSPLLPPTLFFHPRPTFLVAVGVNIQHRTPREKHKAKLGQILHAAQITQEDRSL